MAQNEAMVERLRIHHKDYRKWSELHSNLEIRLDSFNRMKFLTAEEEFERKNLQKQKLVAKDHMQVILVSHKRMS